MIARPVNIITESENFQFLKFGNILLLLERSEHKSELNKNKIIINAQTLLLHGIAISMNFNGESVLQKLITGTPTYDASVTAWWSTRGSETISRRGS